MNHLEHSKSNATLRIAVSLNVLLLMHMTDFSSIIFLSLSQSFQLEMHPKDFLPMVGHSQTHMLVCGLVHTFFLVISCDRNQLVSS